MGLRSYLRRGEPMIWLTGAALGTSLLMIGGLIIVILVNGLGFFWPSRLEQVKLEDGTVLLGDVIRREAIPNPGEADHLKKNRIQLRVGNRDLVGNDFRWIDEDEIASIGKPEDAYFVERREYGPLIGYPLRVKESDAVIAEGREAVSALLPGLLD
jgi:phosphate transport system permease protein